MKLDKLLNCTDYLCFNSSNLKYKPLNYLQNYKYFSLRYSCAFSIVSTSFRITKDNFLIIFISASMAKLNKTTFLLKKIKTNLITVS